MNYILMSIITIVSFVLLYHCLYKYPKSDTIALNGFIWSILTIIIVILCLTFILGVVNLIKIPINLATISIINYFLSIIILFRFKKNKKFQVYFYKKYDFLVFIFLFFIVTLFTLYRFTPELLIIYETSDPSQHFRMARDIINTEQVKSMYFGGLFNAVNIMIFKPFINDFDIYKIFIVSDSFSYWLAISIFFCLIRKYLDSKLMKIIGIVVTLLYMFGYPLSNQLFGFVYLGHGVMLITSLIFFSNSYFKNEINSRLSLFFMMLNCYSIIISYVLFAPIIFISLSLCIMYKYKKFFSKQNIFTQFCVFLLPCILGLIYIFAGTFHGNTSSIGSAIAMEGYITRELFSDFILILPFSVYGLFILKKRNKIVMEVFYYPLIVLFIIILLCMGLNGKVSSYYYYKNYFPLWMLSMFLFTIGVASLIRKSKSFVIIYSALIVILPITMISKFDLKIHNINPNFSPNVASSVLSSIYYYNSLFIKRPLVNYNKEDIEFYRQVSLYTMQDINNKVPFIGDWIDTYWYEALTNQRIEEFYTWLMDFDIFINKVREKNIKFIVAKYDSEMFENHKEYLEKFNKVWSNQIGGVYEVN